MSRLLKSLFARSISRWILPGLALLAATNLNAAAGLDTSSRVAFFMSTADQLLNSSPELAGFSCTNFPIYPVGLYTPAAHRLFQLAANLTDARANKTGVAPDDFDYPSVFRPTFGITSVGFTTNVFINGWVEVGTNADYLSPPLSLPDDLGLIGANTTNIYGIPWIIGARKGLPNFNEISVQSITRIARKLQIVKPSIGAQRTTWHTNVQYVLSISNAVGVEAWNSYHEPYSRSVDIIVGDYLTMVLTNENGVLLATNTVVGLPLTTISNWPGFTSSFLSNSFVVPVLTNYSFLNNLFYQNGTLSKAPSFQTTTGYPQPLFGFNVTNRLRFIMLDHASGRVIDYVHLDGMIQHRKLTAELRGPDDYGPGGVWDTNRINGSQSSTVPAMGMVNQILVSLNRPPFINAAYSTPVTSNDWSLVNLVGTGFSSVDFAVAAFLSFYNGHDTTNLVMQVPFTAVRTVSMYNTWQANDPLVHYTLSDLTGLGDLAPPDNGTTNYLDNSIALTNFFLPNIGRVNNRYLPWNGQGNPNPPIDDGMYLNDPTLRDPLVFSSDDWNFPVGQLDCGVLGRVHRGTPWQTVYLKASPVDNSHWQNWVGDANPFDSLLSQPTNDWRIASRLAPLLNPIHPAKLFSVNHTNLAVAMTGMSAITNSAPPAAIEMTPDSPQLAAIVDGINAVRTAQPNGMFLNIGDILSVPELSTHSPWLDLNATETLTDEAYETLPSQLLPLLRADSLGGITAADNLVQVRFTGLDGYLYQIEVSSNLRDWTPVATGSPTNGYLLYYESTSASPVPRYFRSILLPNP